ncbi:MAG: hypothetical protein DI572_08895, partial [Staphylococcus epidermidis]
EKIQNKEWEIIQACVYLHDIIDDKICQDSKQASYELTQWLYSQDLAIAEVEHILDILENISFKAGTGLTMKTLEGQIVQDADRLDAIGAIGIARTFQFSGHFGEPMWTETKFSNEALHTSHIEELDNSAIKHFYEKLFKLKDLMHTPTAKKLAEERHQFMIQYLKQFMSEWNFNKEQIQIKDILLTHVLTKVH